MLYDIEKLRNIVTFPLYFHNKSCIQDTSRLLLKQ